MSVVAERASLWEAGPGILDLPGADVARRDTRLRPMADEELARVLSVDPERRIPELAVSEAARAELLAAVFDLRRGSWQVACALSATSVVADLDFGFGAVGRALAPNVGLVIGIDDVRERLRVAEALNASQGLTNFRLAHGNVRAIESWDDGCVDGVSLGRRLREVGDASVSGRAERLALLRQVRRVLRSDGWLSLAADNGHELQSLLRGGPAANPGVTGWRQLLEEAGFEDVSIYAAAPDHDHCNTLVPWTRGGDVRAVLRGYGIRKPWKLSLLESPMLRPFAPRALRVVAYASGGTRPTCLNADRGHPLRSRRIYLSSGKASIWYRRRKAGRQWIRDVPLDRASVESAARLETLADAWAGTDSMPAFFADRQEGGDRGEGGERGRRHSDRRNVRGMPLTDLPGGAHDARLQAVCDVLRTLRDVGDRARLPVLGRADVVRHFLEANANARARIDQPFAERLQRVAEALTQRYPGGPALVMHGDLTPNNVLFDSARPEFIDWDLATPVDFPGYDVMNLVWYRHCGPSPEPGFWAGVVDDCAAGRADETAARWIREACGDVDVVGVLATFVVLRLARGAAFGDAWVAEHGTPALERAEAWLGSIR